MAAGKWNLEIEQNSIWRENWVVKTGDPAEPVDLTGADVTAQIRLERDGGALILDMTPYLTLGAEGTIDLEVPKSVTEDLDFGGRAYWDLKLDDVRLLQGRVRLDKGVTP